MSLGLKKNNKISAFEINHKIMELKKKIKLKMNLHMPKHF